MGTFIPDKPIDDTLEVPFFEDSSEQKIPGRGTEKSHEQLQSEIVDLMLKLGAGAARFAAGKFPTKPERYGWQITFSMNGVPGRIELAALPIRQETPSKKKQALAQALYLFRNYLEGEVWSAVYRPGAIALLPFLMGEGGKTVTEALMERNILPDVSPYWLPPLLGSGG